MTETSHPDYDAGLLNDFGGGNTDWWLDYIRAEIGRANDHWRDHCDTQTDAVSLVQFAEIERLREALAFYANPEVYKPHPHGIGFDRRDISYVAVAALAVKS